MYPVFFILGRSARAGMKRTDRGKLDTGKGLESRERAAAVIREGKAEVGSIRPGRGALAKENAAAHSGMD